MDIKQKEHSQRQKQTFPSSLPGWSAGGRFFAEFLPLAKETKDSYQGNVTSVKIMEIENLSSSVKIFYFRNENVILRVPFCFILQLVTYFDKIAKESKEEDTETWYEIAGTRPSCWLLKISSHVGKQKNRLSPFS